MVKVKGLRRAGESPLGQLALLIVWCSLVCSPLAARASEGELLVLAAFGFRRYEKKRVASNLYANINRVTTQLNCLQNKVFGEVLFTRTEDLVQPKIVNSLEVQT